MEMLEQLLARASSGVAGARMVAADEVSYWPPGFLSALRTAGWLAEAEPARTVLCDACREGHWEEPIEVGEDFDFIRCDVFGRVAVPSSRRTQWQIDAQGVVEWCRRQLGLRRYPDAIVDGRVWRIGKVVAGGRSWNVFVVGDVDEDSSDRLECEMVGRDDELFLLLNPSVDTSRNSIALGRLVQWDNALALDRALLDNHCADHAERGRPMTSITEGDLRYSPDFRTVLLRDERFDLTPNQARVVEILWKQLTMGVDELSQHYVLEHAEIQSDRLYHVFRKSNAWGRLVVPGSARGMFRLNTCAPQIHR
jgi:hypothetical protein